MFSVKKLYWTEIGDISTQFSAATFKAYANLFNKIVS